MPYVHHNNQYLYSLTPAKWEALLDNQIIHQLLVGGFKTITNVRNTIKDIATTKNKKFRRGKIDSFVMLCDSIKMLGMYEDLTEWIVAVSKELDSVDLNYDNIDLSKLHNETTTPVIRKYPEYDVSSAYQIGDSNHYTSCLRSGLQRYVAHLKDNAREPITWETKDTLRRTWYDQFRTYEGCNYRDFTRLAEVKAYKDGDMVYATIGRTVTEGGEGYLGRFRIYRCKNVETGTLVWVLGEYYGQDQYIPLLLSKILRTLGPDVYTDSDTTMVTSQKPITVDRAFDTKVYSDLSKHVFKLLSANRPKPRVLRNTVDGKRYFTVTLKGYSTVPEARTKKINRHREHYLAQTFIKYPIDPDVSTENLVDTVDYLFVGHYINLVNECFGTNYRCVKNNRYSRTIWVLHEGHNDMRLVVYYDTVAFDTELYSCVIGDGRLVMYQKGHKYDHRFEVLCIKGNQAIRRFMKNKMINRLNLNVKSNKDII